MGFVSRRVMVSHGIARDRHKSAGCAMVSNCKGGMRWECNYLLPFSCLHAVPYLVPHCQAHAVSPLKGPCSFRLQPDTCLCLITPVLNCKFSSCLGCLEDSPCSCSRRGLSPSAELFLGKPLQAGGSMQAAVLLEISRPALSLPDVPAGHSSMTTAPSPLLPGCCRAQRAGTVLARARQGQGQGQAEPGRCSRSWGTGMLKPEALCTWSLGGTARLAQQNHLREPEPLEPGSVALGCLGAGAQAAAEDLAAAPPSAADRGGQEQGDVPGALFNFLSNQNKGPVTSCAASDHLI